MKKPTTRIIMALMNSAKKCGRHFFNALFVLLLLTNMGIKTAAQPNGSLAGYIDNLLASWQSNKGPAISIAVVKNGNVVYSNSLGMANIKSGIANDSSTQFWVASVSKQFTAAAIYQLALEKKVGLERSVRTYLPELPELYQPVTINHLVHHTSGIRDGFVLTALSKKPPSQYTNENVLHYVKASAEFNFKPGTSFEYNNAGYVLLALVIERVSNQSYPVYMKENFFHPLGMNSTYVSPNFPASRKQAEGYRENGPGEFQEYHFEGNTYGSTGVITTITDLAKWSAFLQQPGYRPALALLVPSLLQQGKLNNGQPIAYGGGLEKFVYRNRVMYEHFGSDEGFKADMIYFPGTKVSVIGLTNHHGYYGLLSLLCNISDLVHGDRIITQIPLDESKHMISESVFYDPSQPQLVKLQRFEDFVKIGNTPMGYAAPYIRVGDTLQSFDPIPAKYIAKVNYIQAIDPYFQKNYRLPVIKPVTEKSDLPGFTGEYMSKELETSYKIIAGENGLKFEFVPGLAFDMYRLTNTDFVFEYLGPNYVQFTPGGFMFSREGCRKLKLKKQ